MGIPHLGDNKAKLNRQRGITLMRKRNRPHRHPFYKKSWFWAVFVSLLLGMLCAGGVYAYRIWTAGYQTYEPPVTPPSVIKQPDKEPTALLLLGIDETPGDAGRSDTIMVATLNPKQKSMLFTSIPRDTYVTIPGRSGKTKINHSYAYGKADLTRQTVENFLDIPIDGYVRINMPGLEAVVDALGGIEVNVPFDFTYSGYTFHKGKMKLNGKEALAFSRMRKQDPLRLGDTGRVLRQQETIRGIIARGKQLSTITKLPTLVDQLGSNIKTDIPPLRLLELQQTYANVKDQDIKTITLQGEGKYMAGIYYYIVSDAEVKRVHDLLIHQLQS
jgi:polyisoprenyl-teichoic acid--peptidoglycan teichoic acid transferase